jgi:hypothetical protein
MDLQKKATSKKSPVDGDYENDSAPWAMIKVGAITHDLVCIVPLE